MRSVIRKFTQLSASKENIFRITIDSPPVNSLNLELIKKLKSDIQQAERSTSEAIILTSNCRVFCAGLDLRELYGKSKSELKEFWYNFQDLIFSLYGSKKFVVCEIGGHAPAGGTLLSMCCDSRVALEGTMHGLNESAFGLVVPQWGCDMMINLTGNRLAYQALSKGTLFNSDEALKIGLIDSVIQGENIDKLRDATQAECEKWLQSPGREETKTMLRQPVLNRWVEQREDDLNQFVNSVSSPVTQVRIRDYLASLSKKSSR